MAENKYEEMNKELEVTDFNDVEPSAKDTEEEEKEHSAFREILGWIIPFVVAIVLVFVLKTYVIINANVPTGSMETTIMTHDNLIGYRLAYVHSDPKRGDVVIFPCPDKPQEKYIKRIVGMPGETLSIHDGKVYINGEELEEDYITQKWGANSEGMTFEIPEGCYFMMGDNRNNSEDARFWNNHFVKKEDIIGKAVLIYWPFSHFKTL